MLYHVAAVKISPYIIIVQIVFSGPLGSLDSFRVILKIEISYSRCSGAWQALHIIEPGHEKTNILHMRKQRRRSASR